VRTLSFILILLISTSGFAQKKVKLRPKTYQDIVKSANEIRAKENEIRGYFMQIVLRKAQMDVVRILKSKRMSDEDVQKVLQSAEMKTFLTNLEKNPKMQERVNIHVKRLVKPGAIEAHVLKRREQMAKKQQEQVLLVANELRKAKDFRTKETIHEKVDDRPLITKIWNHLVDDLYAN